MATPGRKDKEFRDPVHGYISVPAEWCTDFIDTAIFQRLRHIEQTSMRPLYPSARHDRFTHSLGVYHLAKLAFRHLKKNTKEDILAGVDIGKYWHPFLIAALMHDCAHACFSHTFEKHYTKKDNKDDVYNRAENFLLSFVDDKFRTDYTKLKSPPAAHELFSAAIFLKHFGEKLTSADQPILVARMITGLVHEVPDPGDEKIENCLIRLINGEAIDVDNLDYILRDTWASGVDNVSIDVQRLLSALEIVKINGRLEVAFRKSALSVLQSVVDGRNYLYRWIYSHHTVCYFNRLLRDAVVKLDKVLSHGGIPDEFLDAVFSEKSFSEPVEVGPDSVSVFLPCDDDIYSLLKAKKDLRKDNENVIPEVEELLSRRPTRVPLWKTQAEFEIIFDKMASDQLPTLREHVRNFLEPVLKELHENILVEPVKPKMTDLMKLDKNKLWVNFESLDKIESFDTITRKWQETSSGEQNKSFFYVYIPREAEDLIPNCIEALKRASVA